MGRRQRQAFAIIRTIHAWSGATLSLLLAVLGLSGTLLVFRDDWLRAVFPSARDGLMPIPDNLATIADAAEATFGDRLVSAVFGTPDMGLTRLYLTNDDAAWLGPDGTVLAQWSGNARPETWVFDLHHHLLAGHTGEIVSGIAGLAAAALTVTGLVALWPARRAIGLQFWPGTNQRSSLLSAHRNLGLIAALPLLVLCLTGAAMVFPGPAKALLSAFRPLPAQSAEINATYSAPDWNAVFTAAQERAPDAAIRIARWPSPDVPAISLRLRQPAEWHPNGRTYVLADPATARTTLAADAQTQPTATRLYNTLYPVHAAHLGRGLPGRLYDLVCALTGLALTALGLIGVWAFLKHRILR